MFRTLNYFLQSLFVYLFFFIGRILGINLSRRFFSGIFILIGPFFKSNKIINKNLKIFSSTISLKDKRAMAEFIKKAIYYKRIKLLDQGNFKKFKLAEQN